MQVLLWLLHLLSATCCPFRVAPMMMQHVQWAWNYWLSCHLNSAGATGSAWVMVSDLTLSANLGFG